MLSVALLPLGLITISQTWAVTKSFQETAEASQLALAEQAVLGERRILYAALGVSSAIGAVARDTQDDLTSCRRYLARVVRQSEYLVDASFIPLDGVIQCTSTSAELDVSGSPIFESQLDDPRLRVERVENAPISGVDVVAITRPILDDEDLKGFVSVSVPLDLVRFTGNASGQAQLQGSMLFNGSAEVIAGELGGEERPLVFPEGLALEEFVGSEATVFSGSGADGIKRTYAVVPVLPGSVHSITAWPFAGPESWIARFGPVAFPIAMWAASFVVGYLAVHRLVIRHVRALTREMRTFARHRKLPNSPASGEGTSLEIEDINSEFRSMADTLLRDEAALEDTLREKNELLSQTNVLMKEVHHRVKNNLQLISSIMSMHMRKAESPETREVLERLQDRVLGLATVHRNLYRAESTGAVNAGELISEVAGQLLSAGQPPGVNVKSRYDRVVLYPDQAVPLSLLAAESLTNALKYVDVPESGEGAEIFIGLHAMGGRKVRFEVTNTCKGLSTDQPHKEAQENSDRLGSRLIRAFASQLGTDISVERSDSRHTISLDFEIEEFRAPREAVDY